MEPLNDRENYWLERGQDLFRKADPQPEAIQAIVKELLGEFPNPYVFPAKLLLNKKTAIQKDNKTAKHKTFLQFLKHVITATTDWVLEKYTEEERELLLTAHDNLYIKTAFEVTYTYPKRTIYIIVNTLYNFPKIGKQLEPFVLDLAEKDGQYSLAMDLLLELNLNSSYYVEAIIFPAACFVSERSKVKTYFERYPQDLATFVDLILSVTVAYKTKPLCRNLVETHNYKNISETNFTYEYFNNILLNICRWNVGNANMNVKTYFVVNNEVYRRIRGDITPQSFLDRMMNKIDKADTASQINLITKLLQSRLFPEANVLLEYFNLDVNEYPEETIAELEQAKLKKVQPLRRSANEYKLNLNEVNYNRIYTEDKFKEMLIYLREEQEPTAVTIRRTISLDQKATYCLLQVAKKSNIFLIDLIMGDISKESWQQLATFLNQADILGNTLTCAILDIPQLKDLEEPIQPKKVLNIIKYAIYLARNANFTSVIANLPKRVTTGEVVFELFRMKMPTGRSTAWNVRPVAAEGIYYQALTTYALFDIKKCLDSRIRRMGLEPSVVELEFKNSIEIPTK